MHNSFEIKHLLTVAAASLATTFSAQAQFSVTLSSVESIGGAASDNGQPINCIYDFNISGDFPANPDYVSHGISLSMSGFGYAGAIAGGFDGSNVGGWLPSDPPEFSSDSISFEDYYSGGQIYGAISVMSAGSPQDNFSWNIAELGSVFPNSGQAPYTALSSYCGTVEVPSNPDTVVVPEPAHTGLHTGLLFGLAVLAPAAAPFLPRRRSKVI
jgi:hypothetical protein